jgi:hypothetical protein
VVSVVLTSKEGVAPAGGAGATTTMRGQRVTTSLLSRSHAT